MFSVVGRCARILLQDQSSHSAMHIRASSSFDRLTERKKNSEFHFVKFTRAEENSQWLDDKKIFHFY